MKLNILTIFSGVLFLFTIFGIYFLLIHCDGGSICVFNNSVILDVYVTCAFLLIAFPFPFTLWRLLLKEKKERTGLSRSLIAMIALLLAIVLLDQLLWLPFTLKHLIPLSYTETYRSSNILPTFNYPYDISTEEKKEGKTYDVNFQIKHSDESKPVVVCSLYISPLTKDDSTVRGEQVKINGNTWERLIFFTPRFHLPMYKSNVSWKMAYKGNAVTMYSSTDRYILCEKILSTFRL